MQPLPIFQNIAREISKRVQKAQSEILVHVPWFTDQSLFEELVVRAQAGVQVSIAIEDDNINQSANFSHSEIVQHGGRLYLNQSGGKRGLNHEKYCVIDQHTVIFGSYNWTYNAANKNRESIIVFEDPLLAKQYSLRFQEMTQLNSVTCFELSHKEMEHPKGQELLDPKLILKTEIQLLEVEIAQLEEEKADLDNKIEYANNYIQLALRELLLEKLQLESLLAEKEAQQTDKAVDKQKAEHRKREAEEAHKVFESIEDRQKVLESFVDEVTLKKLYREACIMAHPDKLINQPEKQQKANELMSSLTEAYRNRNLDKVQAIWQSLVDGTAFGFDWNTPADINTLNSIRETLLHKKHGLIRYIETLKQSYTYNILQQNTLNEFIVLERQKLQTEVEVLKKEVTYKSK